VLQEADVLGGGVQQVFEGMPLGTLLTEGPWDNGIEFDMEWSSPSQEIEVKVGVSQKVVFEIINKLDDPGTRI